MQEEKTVDAAAFEPHNNFGKIFAVQIFLVIIIVAGVLAVKWISPADYEKIKEFYASTFAVDTDVNEVLSGETENADQAL